MVIFINVVTFLNDNPITLKMPIIVKESETNGYTLGIWEITEEENYFLKHLRLSKNDKELLNKAKSNQRRFEILSVRLLLKSLGLDLEISYSESGKPIVQSGNISISHTKLYSAILYHPQKNVCVDIEKISNIVSKGKHLVFNESEIEYANNAPERLTILWCCKECIVKIRDNVNVNFLTQISINPIKAGQPIECVYIESGLNKRYLFRHLRINDHIIVWGIDNC
jgi:phosphopantetheinyl transferase